MKRDELFRIWDATNPTFDDIKAYLDWFCRVTPLELAFRKKDGSMLYQNKVDNNLEFVGIVINNHIFYARGFTKEDLNDVSDSSTLSVGTIVKWIKNNPFFPTDAHLISEDDFKIIAKSNTNLDKTIKILEYNGIKMPKSKDGLFWFSRGLKSVYANSLIGITPILHSINDNDYWICSDKL